MTVWFLRMSVRLPSLLCVITLGVGCSAKDEPGVRLGQSVTDFFGERVTIPANVRRVIPISHVQSEYMCIVGARDKVVGVGVVHPNSVIFERICPDIYALPRVGANTINLETIVELDPDVVLSGNNRQMVENITRLGIVAVGSFPRDIDGIVEQVRLTGLVAGKEEEAQDIIDHLSSRMRLIREVTEAMPADQKPRVYYARYQLHETMGGGIYSEIIDVAGGRNVVSHMGESGQSLVVSLENIYEWNPEIIILRDKTPLSVDDLLNDPRLKGIRAIRNHRIYRETSNWSEFRIETFFGIMEKAKWFHPGLFTDLDPAVEYENFLELVESFYR